MIDKTIETLDKLPDDKKAKIIRLYRSAIKTWRICLWITPFVFLLFVAVYVLLFIFPELTSAFPDTDIRRLVLLAEVFLVIAFIHFWEDSYYKKKVLKAIDK